MIADFVKFDAAPATHGAEWAHLVNSQPTVCAPPWTTGMDFHLRSGIRWIEAKEASNQVNGFAAMGPDWDGYGAEQIAAEVARNAIRAFEVLAPFVPLPDFSPNANGTISLEWDNDIGFAHLEVGKTRFSLYAKNVSNSRLSCSGDLGQLDMELGRRLAELIFSTHEQAAALTAIVLPEYVRLAPRR